MSSEIPRPDELESILEDYSLKLEDFKSKFNPFFSEVSFELKKRVDHLRSRIELYAKYHQNHQLKHLIESKRAKAEISAVHLEVETLQSKMKELERVYKLGQDFF